MKNSLSLIILTTIGATCMIYLSLVKAKDIPVIHSVNSVDDVRALFPQTTSDLERRVDAYINEAQKDVDAIIAIENNQRTFENTARAYDRVSAHSNFYVIHNICEVLSLVSPNTTIREAAQKSQVKIRAFAVDALENNYDLYKALKQYVDTQSEQENLSDEQRYFLSETLADFKRHGLDLPEEQRKKVVALKKEIQQLCVTFDANIAKDNKTITVSREALAGVDEAFIAGLKKNDAGQYLLGVDYPTYFAIMQHCSVEQTRKDLSRAFGTRGYPVNKPLLEKIIALRDELAHLLGHTSYAHFELSNEMVKSPENAHSFLQGLLEKARIKEQQEFKQLTQRLPQSVTLVDDKFKPWDIMFVKEQYKKEHFKLDERKVAEYFPMQKTIDGLLDIYQDFLNIRFEYTQEKGFWHEDVKLIKAYDKQDSLLGYLLLDLHPRPNKYGHAAQADIINAVKHHDGKDNPPAVLFVVANFPKATHDKPSLLKFDDVSTFFHEFGHAMHALLGRTDIASFAGTNTKLDFVELPSQMLEEWMYDKAILRSISSHYQTGESLPESMINTLVELKNFDTGHWVARQALLARIALAYYAPGATKDPYTIAKSLAHEMVTTTIVDKETHFYASWGHLTSYASRYYGYLWSKVFALDLFAHIAPQGLRNPQAGQHYINEVIGKGGSVDPNQLLKNFLGREPNDTAFFKALGL